MGELVGIINELQSPNVLIIGDLNADVIKETLFGKHLKNICDDNDLICCSVDKLPRDSYTHVNYGWYTRSWLDHCLGTSGGDKVAKNFKIMYDISCRDHIPLQFELDIGENYQKIVLECEKDIIILHGIKCHRIK